jgi:hypothetical protein
MLVAADIEAAPAAQVTLSGPPSGRLVSFSIVSVSAMAAILRSTPRHAPPISLCLPAFQLRGYGRLAIVTCLAIVIGQTNACFDASAQCGVALARRQAGRARVMTPMRAIFAVRSGGQGTAWLATCCRRNSPQPRQARFRAASLSPLRLRQRGAPRLSPGSRTQASAAASAWIGAAAGGCMIASACIAHQTVSRRGSRKAQKPIASWRRPLASFPGRRADARWSAPSDDLAGGGKGVEHLARGAEAQPRHAGTQLIGRCRP